MKTKYSKPVLLGSGSSSYIKEKKFQLEIMNSDNAVEKDDVHLKLKITMNSEILSNLISEGKAEMGVKIKTGLAINYQKVKWLGNGKSETDVFVELSKLKRKDIIVCTAFVTANDELEYAYNNELLDIYKSDDSFMFKKNEVLGESTSDKLSYQASGDPFIQIKSIEGQNDISFSLCDNIISVNVGEDVNSSFTKLQNESKIASPKAILDTFVAFNAILYSLIKAITSGIDKYLETEWFKALDYNFDEPGYDDLKSYLDSISGNTIGDLDIDSLIKMVQKILNNQLSISIIKTQEVADGNRTS